MKLIGDILIGLLVLGGPTVFVMLFPETAAIFYFNSRQGRKDAGEDNS